MSPTDHHMETLFRDSTSDLSPDVSSLVAGGIARGRSRRRRQNAWAALASVAVVGVIGAAAAVAPGLGSDPEPGFASSDEAVTPALGKPADAKPTTGPALDVGLAVAAADIPVAIAEMLPPGELGPPLREHPFALVDRAHKKIVHFRWNGTLTTFIVEPESSMGSCAELAAATPGGSCNVVGGLEVLTWPATNSNLATGHGAIVWQHGYIANAVSYNAPYGKDVAPVVDAPPIGLEKLTEIARSEVWFE